MSETDYDRETGEIMPVDRGFAPAAQGQIAQMIPLASAETTEVCTALAKVQGEIEAPKRTKTATVRPRDTSRQGYTYSYAPLEEIVRVLQKPMAQAGLSRQQYIVTRGGAYFVRTIIWHTSGQWLSSDYPIFAEAMSAQQFASGVTYAKRQGLSLVFGLAPEDDDDENVAEANAVQAQHGRAAKPNGAAQPTADKAVAQEKWKIVRDLIHSAMTIPDLVSIVGDHNLPPSAEWRDMTDAVNKIEETEVANRVFAELRDRIDKRLAMILGENLEGPMAHGKMGD